MRLPLWSAALPGGLLVAALAFALGEPDAPETRQPVPARPPAAHTPPKVTTEADEPAAAVASPAPRPAPAPEEVVADVYADVERLDDVIATEGVDPTWDRAVRQRADVFAATEAPPGAHVRKIACGQTVCRVDVDVDDEDALEGLTRVFGALLDPDAEGFAHVEGETDREVNVYLSRSGTGLDLSW
jgi:hypothetical protein